MPNLRYRTDMALFYAIIDLFRWIGKGIKRLCNKVKY